MVATERKMLHSMDEYLEMFYPTRYARKRKDAKERQDPGAEAFAIGFKHGAILGDKVLRAIQEIVEDREKRAAQSS